jgi:amidophosphoribosyltransferase
VCGVVGVVAPEQHVSHLAYLALYALQHRGQEAAGMAVSDGVQLTVVKDQGLVAGAFDDRTLATLDGHVAVGHTRYSTTGSSTWRNAQPVYRDVADRQFALGHNGNLTNTAALADEAGMLDGTVTSDSDLIAELIGQELAAMGEERRPDDIERAVRAVLPRLEGAFSLVVATDDQVLAVRDPHGFRPLCLGKLPIGWIVASESPALDIVGAHFVRELDPGELVILDVDEAAPRSVRPFHDEVDPHLCIFEFFYFARPDSKLYGRSVHAARVRMGELLAEQAPADADMVMGVPESGIAAAEGFAKASGIPYGQGLVKNRYIGRTFIAPSQELRENAVRLKLNPLRDNIAGKRLVVVDDSIVRGTTQRQLTKMLREVGAAEIHLRITSPPVRWPCFYGIDIGDRAELLATQLETVEDIRQYIGVDSLAYLSLDRLLGATGAPGAGFCHACFTGEYPVEVPVGLSKQVLDEPTRVPAGELEQLLHEPG